MNTSTSPNRTNSHDSSPPRQGSRAAKHVQYQGPTSVAYNLGVATASLQDMGIHTRAIQDDMNNTSYSTTPARSSPSSNEMTFLRDPLLSITLNQATHLVRIYEEESGTVYQFIDIDLVMRTAEQFYGRSIMSNGGNSVVSDSHDTNMLSGGVVDILKLVIAIALVIQGHGPTALSSALLDNVETGFKGRLCGPSVDILEIQAWTLMVCPRSSSITKPVLTHDRVFFNSNVMRRLLPGEPSVWLLEQRSSLAFNTQKHT